LLNHELFAYILFLNTWRGSNPHLQLQLQLTV
jgi:hypothetical protein